MGLLKEEIKRNTTRGDRKSERGFTGAIRSLEAMNLEKGDVLVFPEEYEVYEQKVGDTGKAQYIFVTIDGTENVKPFYPSVFTKRRMIYNEDGTSTGERVYTTGTAADLFRSYQTVQEGMEVFKGKKIKVTDVKNIRTLRFNSTEVVTTQIPVIDLVD